MIIITKQLLRLTKIMTIAKKLIVIIEVIEVSILFLLNYHNIFKEKTINYIH